jgi:hypothetical protein
MVTKVATLYGWGTYIRKNILWAKHAFGAFTIVETTNVIS